MRSSAKQRGQRRRLFRRGAGLHLRAASSPLAATLAGCGITASPSNTRDCANSSLCPGRQNRRCLWRHAGRRFDPVDLQFLAQPHLHLDHGASAVHNRRLQRRAGISPASSATPCRRTCWTVTMCRPGSAPSARKCASSRRRATGSTTRSAATTPTPPATTWWTRKASWAWLCPSASPSAVSWTSGINHLNYAAFGQANFNVTSKLQVFAGARVTHDRLQELSFNSFPDPFPAGPFIYTGNTGFFSAIPIDTCTVAGGNPDIPASCPTGTSLNAPAILSQTGWSWRGRPVSLQLLDHGLRDRGAPTARGRSSTTRRAFRQSDPS